MFVARFLSNMIEEVQVKTISRRTRSERNKRRERYLQNGIQKDKKNDNGRIVNRESPILSPSYPINNNNCHKCGQPVNNKIEKIENMSNTSPAVKPKDHLYKILVIGDLGTGKTSIIKRYVHQFFSQHYRATIGVDFALKVINWDANTLVRLQLWDIAGQERYGNMTRVYYKEAVGAFIVFDVTRASTFDSVANWKADLDSKVQLPDGSSIPCVLLANKCDQPKEGIVTNSAKMDEYCKEKEFTAWYETSAKENINIDDAARALVTKILQNDVSANNDKGDQFMLSSEKIKEKKGCSCKYF